MIAISQMKLRTIMLKMIQRRLLNGLAPLGTNQMKMAATMLTQMMTMIQ